jgi:multidrug efflux pump subunit AcrB
MNIAELAIRKSTITWTLSILLLVVGYKSFNSLPRLEDPEFTIKDAIISTPYPGASAKEVEEEVSDVIERAVQELGQLKRVQSTNTRGMSSVKATIKDQYDAAALPQVWDELRRKVNDYQSRLPPGAGPSIVNDDFGDVYGVYAVLTGEGYTMAELYEYAKLLRRELLLVQDVKRVILWGNVPETIFIEMSRAKMAALQISQDDIFRALQARNLPADAGRIELGTDFIAIVPTGEFQSEKEFGELLITTRGGEGQLVFLRDVASVRRGYRDPPTQIIRHDGKQGIGIGISTVKGGNVVTMGEALQRKFEQLRAQTPIGMDIGAVSLQSEAVTAAIGGFMVNLLEAVAIVFVVLMIFMGLRSGALIGGILFLTIFGTFVFMQLQGVMLERISLGALIIALGMLVDNAIVIVDGMQVRIEQGMDRIKAASEVVGQNMIPLLGATVIAVLAFASIGTSQDSTGEYTRSLYTVILISLMLSWVTAITTTPLLAKIFLKGKKEEKPGEEPKDPYGGKFYQGYKAFLSGAIRRRWVTVGVIVGIFLVSLWGFGYVSNMFFPNSTRPQFFADIWLPEGTHIRDTERELARAEEYFTGLDGVTHVSTAIGGGDLRFLLTYTPNPASSAFGAMFVDVDDWTIIDSLQVKTQRELQEILPEAIVNIRKFRLGPGEGGQIQLRISGRDGTVLREMAATAKEILREEGGKGIRDEWREQVKTVQPVLADAQARQLGIDRPELAQQLRAARRAPADRGAGAGLRAGRRGQHPGPPDLEPGGGPEHPDAPGARGLRDGLGGCHRLPLEPIAHDSGPRRSGRRAGGRPVQPREAAHREGAEHRSGRLYREELRGPRSARDADRDNHPDRRDGPDPDQGHARLLHRLGRRGGGQRPGPGRSGAYAADLLRPDGPDRRSALQFNQEDFRHLAHRAARDHRRDGRTAALPAAVRIHGAARVPEPDRDADQELHRPGRGDGPPDRDGEEPLPRRRGLGRGADAARHDGRRHHDPRDDPAAYGRLLRIDGGDDHGRTLRGHDPDLDRGSGALHDLLPDPVRRGRGA